MSLSIAQVVFDCAKPSLLSNFWAEALGYEKEDWGDEIGSMAYDTNGGGTRMFFLTVPEGKAVKNRVHIDVHTADSTMEAEVERLVKLGATAVQQKTITIAGSPYTWTIMQDPEGNEFCVSTKH